MASQPQIEKDCALIDELGGVRKVADMLGYPPDGGVQRVQNWKARGIPPAVKVMYPAIFLSTKKRRPTAPAEQGVAHG